MARADLLISLVRAASNGDRNAIRVAVEALAADERAKKHGVLADRLVRALGNSRSQSSGTLVSPAAESPSSGKDFLIETQPTRSFDSLVLELSVRASLDELIEEQQRADILRSYGLQPRHTVLLSGPPGNGKTSVAEAVAYSMALPLMSVRYDALIGTYLGETNQRLRRMFDYVRSIPCVLFFDEFDAVGKERGDSQETGEIKRLVASLLLQMDALPSYVIVVAATNHPELLDRAVWRRFELKLELAAPKPNQLLEFISAETGVALEAVPGLKKAVQTLSLRSYAEAADFVMDVRRRTALALGAMSPEAVVLTRAQIWSQRVGGAHGGRQEQTDSRVQESGSRGQEEGRASQDALSRGGFAV
jgi:SpoVK/Ycf46/Vps4 family AAA+-type ATPase